MNTTIDQVANSNQYAILLCCEGDEAEAERVLHQCLFSARQFNPDSGAPVVGPASPRSAVAIGPVPLVGALGPEDEWNGYQGRHFSLYRTAFVVTSIREDEKAGDDNDVALDMLHATVCYNLAILYHHRALVLGKLAIREKARLMYTFAEGHLARAVASTCREVALLELAIQNNLGHLLDLIGDSEGAMLCWNKMRNVLKEEKYPVEPGSFFRENMALSQGTLRM